MRETKSKLILNIVAAVVGVVLVILVILNIGLIANLNSKNAEAKMKEEYLAYLEQHGSDLTDFINSYSGEARAQVESVIRELNNIKNGR